MAGGKDSKLAEQPRDTQKAEAALVQLDPASLSLLRQAVEQVGRSYALGSHVNLITHWLSPKGWQIHQASARQKTGHSYVHVDPTSALQTESAPSEVEAIRAEQAKLRMQNEMLQSRVVEERRTAARETRRYDQLEARYDELFARYNLLIDRIHERSKANDALQGAIIAQRDGRLRMFETYDGAVKHVGKETAVVLFEVGDDLVEHTYQDEQFIDGRLPKKGDSLTIFVLGAELPSGEQPAEDATEAPEGSDEHPTRPGKHVSGPLEL